MKLIRTTGYYLAAMTCCFSLMSEAAVPSMPENLQPAWLFGEIMLTWDEVPEAAGYNVYRYDSANAVWVQTAANLNAPRYREANVWDPTTYSVTATNADGESAPAGPVVAEQTGEGFVISLNQWMWSIYDTQAVIKWTVDLVAGADGMLEAGTSYTNLTFFARDTNYTGLHQFTVTNLSPGTYYICRITSVASNRTGVTGWTSFTTLPTNNPPVVLDATYNIYEDQYWPL
ncbi:MAG TPA: hypothetical protein VFA77_06400, partial [Candidatus Eisenbacteria bacterium]|nr:hypothetical protein [Candidatus Eisenbacteria bacterium]